MATNTELDERCINTMRFLAADFLIGPDGEPRILELNGMPGLHSWQNPDAGEPVEVAGMLLEAIMAS